jgi:hypothetical protein
MLKVPGYGYSLSSFNWLLKTTLFLFEMGAIIESA